MVAVGKEVSNMLSERGIDYLILFDRVQTLCSDLREKIDILNIKTNENIYFRLCDNQSKKSIFIANSIQECACGLYFYNILAISVYRIKVWVI